MSRWYLDSSAALKLLAQEAESAALARHLDDEAPDLVACTLLETELRRSVARHANLTQQAVSDFLDGMDVYETPPSLFREAGLLPGILRSLDALHLAAAIRIGADCVVTYDRQMTTAAGALGLAVRAPS
ncbi:putative nucleic acid-binding protein [Marmoricola sp. OAE513]|uniref:type II toxin-antitoxin system VapC family toxin n=1 Tax=Marmoricola sp. OAE513 TaxID=2817894 RepID=UPI001AE63951